jgi:imidazolonepropionase-like amidohydrolase
MNMTAWKGTAMMSNCGFSSPQRFSRGPDLLRKCLATATAAGLAFLWASAPQGFGETFLLTGATVHTVSDRTFSPGHVLVRDGKVAAVAPELDAPGAQVMDLTGLHLYPGLIAPTTLLGLTEINAVRATRDSTEVGEYTPDVQSWIAVNPESELIAVARANGITHALPVPLGGHVSGQSGLVALDGWTTEQMAVKCPVALHVFWPEMELNTTPREQFKDKSKWKSLEEQAKERRARLKDLEDFFEEAAAYAKARRAAEKESLAEPTPSPVWEAMLPFVNGERPMMVHANDVRQIKAALIWAETNDFHIVLAGARDAWMVADLLATHKVPVIYENTFSLPERDTDAYAVHFKAPQVLHSAGVRVAFSTGLTSMSAASLRNLPYLAAQAMAFGLPEDEALKGITLYPAQMLGVDDRLGAIAIGRDATFFAADGNVLDIRSNVKRMWIAGREVSLESRHTRLYEKYRRRPKSGEAEVTPVRRQ